MQSHHQVAAQAEAVNAAPPPEIPDRCRNWASTSPRGLGLASNLAHAAPPLPSPHPPTAGAARCATLPPCLPPCCPHPRFSWVLGPGVEALAAAAPLLHACAPLRYLLPLRHHAHQGHSTLHQQHPSPLLHPHSTGDIQARTRSHAPGRGATHLHCCLPRASKGRGWSSHAGSAAVTLMLTKSSFIYEEA